MSFHGSIHIIIILLKTEWFLHTVMCVYLVHMNISLVYQKADHKGLFAMILLLQIVLPLKTLSTE